MALSLLALHNAGIAHLDFKLDNVLVGYDIALKVCDFERSQVFSATPQTIKEGGFIKIKEGTKRYAGPEAQQEKPSNPFAADVYAYGYSVLVILALDYPNANDIADLDQYLNSKGASQGLIDIVKGCLKSRPSERLTMKEVFKKLQYL